mgnify:CR=1 FL=1
MFMRILLLVSIAWVIRLTAPLFTVLNTRDLGPRSHLIAGGLFLLAKSTLEIHEGLEGAEHHRDGRGERSFGSVIVQIMLLDGDVFSSTRSLLAVRGWRRSSGSRVLPLLRMAAW